MDEAKIWIKTFKTNSPSYIHVSILTYNIYMRVYIKYQGMWNTFVDKKMKINGAW